MAYTEEQQKKIDYFRASVRLQAPDVETDVAYKFSDDDLWAILSTVTPTHIATATIETLPDSEFNFVLMLAKKEIYYRLATTTAPFYPLSAEGASLQKNVRFDHYIALVEQVMKDYETMMDIANGGGSSGDDGEDLGTGGEVRSYEQMLQGYHYTCRNYNLADRPTVELTLGTPTETSVTLDWTKFDRGLFSSYSIYLSETPVIDEYVENIFVSDIPAKFFTVDIHRLKYRIDGLDPEKLYFVCVVARDRNGLFGFAQQSFTTAAVPII